MQLALFNSNCLIFIYFQDKNENDDSSAPPVETQADGAATNDEQAAAPSPKTKEATFSEASNYEFMVPATPLTIPSDMKSSKSRHRTPFPTKGILYPDGTLGPPITDEKEFVSSPTKDSTMDLIPSPSPLSAKSSFRPIWTPAAGTVDSMSFPIQGGGGGNNESAKKIPTSVGFRVAAKKQKDLSPLFVRDEDSLDSPKTTNSASSDGENFDSHNKGRDEMISPTGGVASGILDTVSPASTNYYDAVCNTPSTLLGTTPHKVKTPKSSDILN